MSASSKRNLVKTIPGLLVSAFFLWYTFKGISFSQIRALRFTHPAWIAGVLAFTCASYTLRCVRWTRMMRSTRAGFGVCARVLMTSLAANNILPFRIGDIMRVFTYSGDLGASPSVILSTVILEKLLDIFILVLLFVVFMGPGVNPHSRVVAESLLGISTVGLLVMLLGARTLEPLLRKLFAYLPANPTLAPKLQKIEHWVLLALDCIRQIGILGSLLLLVQSAVIWVCEGMIFVSSARLIGLAVDRIGPWQGVSVANLSYLIPSSPGAIGTFEWAVKTSLVSHGALKPQSALFSLALHAWLLISVTGAGGLIFLIHRIRIHNHTPLLEEIETLPTELP
ncbi:lysylphosphatidylglycerol synthase transmembrane domain-containing protein [Edaphobacter bradus]|uniref:lysylphosphatidylglycerol synthase transmembrane domain-containing protein n=1 Tax=Edaphobacter bradus TaxID=2259016 RepID=UPI0021E03C9B|nr:lysylphosphatidylglycerol synthase transmembrane domain-containing protein [Edaphobacter bradus]